MVKPVMLGVAVSDRRSLGNWCALLVISAAVLTSCSGGAIVAAPAAFTVTSAPAGPPISKPGTTGTSPVSAPASPPDSSPTAGSTPSTATGGSQVINSAPNSSPAASDSTGASTALATSTAASRPAAGRVEKLLSIVVENHSVAQMKAQMPYLFQLAQRFAYADAYTAVTHPSLPNYLAISGGDTFGVTDDYSPASHVIHGQSIFGQALAAGLTARAYEESMPGNCVLTGNTAKNYAVKHNPWAYYVDERAACAAFDTSTSTFLADASADRLPNAGLLVPNKCHDAHDTALGCNLATADGYLSAELPAVLASTDFTSGRLAVVVTADEDNTFPGSSTDDGVLTVVLQAGLDDSHLVVSTPLTHYSLSRLYSQVVGATPLRNATTAPDMAAAFGLPVS